MTDKQMEAKARELRELLALITEAQSEAEAIKDELKASMGERESVQAGEYNKADNDPRLYRRRPLSKFSGGIQSLTEFAVLRTACFDKSKALKITYKTVKTARMDTTALKKAMPDIFAAFTKESVTRRFCVA